MHFGVQNRPVEWMQQFWSLCFHSYNCITKQVTRLLIERQKLGICQLFLNFLLNNTEQNLLQCLIRIFCGKHIGAGLIRSLGVYTTVGYLQFEERESTCTQHCFRQGAEFQHLQGNRTGCCIAVCKEWFLEAILKFPRWWQRCVDRGDKLS
jgi:hypothetical protein